MSVDNQLNVVLTEYDVLRGELSDAIKLQVQIYGLYTSVLTGLSGYIWINENYKALLLIPVFSIIFTYRWVWDLQSSVLYSNYIQTIERVKIPRIIGYFDESDSGSKRYWTSWQIQWEEMSNKRSRGWFWSAFLLLGGSTVISFLAYLYLETEVLVNQNILGIWNDKPLFLYTMIISVCSAHIVYSMYRNYQLNSTLNAEDALKKDTKKETNKTKALNEKENTNP